MSQPNVDSGQRNIFDGAFLRKDLMVELKGQGEIRLSERFYETLHQSYFPLRDSSHHFLRSDRFRKCLSLLERVRPKELLEIGFEDPVLSRTMAEHLGCNYVGIDISPTSVTEAQRIGLNALKLDVSSDVLPFEDSVFDGVYCSEVIEHLFNPDFAVEEFKRVLKPSGKILLSTPNLASWYNRLLLPLGVQPVGTEVSTMRILGRGTKALGQGNRPVGHIRVFTFRAFIDFLNLHGLNPVELKGYAWENLGRLNAFDRVLATLPRFASGIIALVEKRSIHTA